MEKFDVSTVSKFFHRKQNLNRFELVQRLAYLQADPSVVKWVMRFWCSCIFVVIVCVGAIDLGFLREQV